MKTLKNLFLDGLAEMYDAETRLVWVMPQMVAAATSAHLQDAIAAHLLEAEEHIGRLEGIFDFLGEKASRQTCETTIALLEENHEMMSAKDCHDIDAALIALVQKIELYEIASYGRLRDWAALLGHEEITGVLQEMLYEDRAANKSLSELALPCNPQESLSEDATAPLLSPPAMEAFSRFRSLLNSCDAANGKKRRTTAR